MHPAVNELTELQDTIRVEPVDFGKTAEDALLQEIQRRYANKVHLVPPFQLLLRLLGS